MLFPSITLILGGARSGKSDYAERLAAELGPRVLFLATAEAGDPEMAQRIAAHRAARPTTWHTVEAPQHLAAALLEVQESPDAILVDCLTLLVSNILLAREAEAATTIEAAVRTELEGLLLAQNQLGAPLIIVSNEVGLGLVPPYPLGRVYRDVLGRANQYLVSRADRVIFMVAGLPMAVKG